MKNRIKELMLEKGLTQEELGKILNVSGRTIGHYENGIRDLDTETINKLAEIFNVSVDYLLCRTDERNPSRPWQPNLSEKDKKDIAKTINEWLQDLIKADGLAFFNGEPVDDETKEYLKDSFEMILKHAKLMNKKKYTPKKYRK